MTPSLATHHIPIDSLDRPEPVWSHQSLRRTWRRFLKHPLAEVLVSLCGFGTRIGARTLAEIGAPYGFKDGGRLAAYAGLTSVDRQSGTSIRGVAKNRAGNHRLKNVMFRAAFVAAPRDPDAK